MELVAILLMVLGFLLCIVIFFGSLTLWGFIENKAWVKRVGVWALLLTSFILGLLFFIAIPTYLISTFFFY